MLEILNILSRLYVFIACSLGTTVIIIFFLISLNIRKKRKKTHEQKETE